MRPLRRRLEAALGLLPAPLPVSLKTIHFALIDRAEMIRVHGEFLGDATETDVITFPYGEIVVCPAVARDQASGHGSDLEREVLLYCLHGLLHLAGYDDTTPVAAKRMARAQAQLLRQAMTAVP